jgi:hypothetical protein
MFNILEILIRRDFCEMWVWFITHNGELADGWAQIQNNVHRMLLFHLNHAQEKKNSIYGVAMLLLDSKLVG